MLENKAVQEARCNRIIRSAEDIAQRFADIAEELPRTISGDYRIEFNDGDYRIIPRLIMEAAIDARKPKRSSIRAYMRANGRAQ